MDALDAVPTPLDVEADLKQIVHELKRWEALPLYALRALPSVCFWTPHPDKRRDFIGKSAPTVRNAAVRERIEEAIERTVLEKDLEALRILFTFDKLTYSLTERQAEAANFRGVTPDSFRKNNERLLLRRFSEEIFRGELEWAVHQVRPLGQAGELDTMSPAAGQ